MAEDYCAIRHVSRSRKPNFNTISLLEQGSSHAISLLLAQSALLCCMIALCDHLSHSQKGRAFFFITGFFESFSIRNKKQKHHRCGSPAARFPHQWPLGPVIQRKNINGDLQFKAWPPSPSSNGCLFPVAQLIHGIGIASRLVSVNRRGSWTLIFSSESIIMARPRFGLLSVNVTGNLITKTPPKKKIPSVMYPAVLSVSSSANLTRLFADCSPSSPRLTP